MKVTVCFDEVRVIVPCGDGNILVSELIDKAVVRYKKATGKGNNHWVSVHNVKAISGGGILDPDDQLSDVVDDREQLIADYEEQGRPLIHHNGGDGASASSTGTASPDIFHTGDLTHLNDLAHRPFPISQQNGKTDVVVTSRDLSVGTTLTVRRGSEPALNTLTDGLPLENGTAPPVILRGRKESHQESDEPRTESDSENDSSLSPPKLDKDKSPLSRFQRDSKRLSLSNNQEMFKWMEAHENALAQHKTQKQLPQVPVERKGPIGGSGKENEAPKTHPNEGAIAIILKNDGGPLGIHVIPDIDDNGRELGLTLQGVEKGGRIERDGRLRVNDRIIEINGTHLEGVSFDSAQKIFRDAMRTPEVRLKVVKHRGSPPPLPKQPPPIMPKPKGHAPAKPSPLTLPPPRGDNSPQSSPDKTSTPLDADVSINFNDNNNVKKSHPKMPMSPIPSRDGKPSSPLPPRDQLPIQPGPPLKVTSPTKKTPPAVPQRHPSTTLSTPKEQPINTLTNTRKIGRKMSIQLKKGPLGLGFSVTSRDNMAGESPIYIKTIQAKGAAVQDGRLEGGDRLLEVNGVEMTGISQSEAVRLLRSIPEGSVCSLVVSRQEKADEQFRVPRELDDEKTPPVLQPPERSGDDGTLSNIQNKEVIKFEIPLNDTGSAGLGVSVKGKTLTTSKGTKDLGIFIKSVMKGGAASKDGRLLINDQLMEVNNIVLTSMSNVNAMDELRKAMQSDGPQDGYILLTIARKIGAPSPFPNCDNSLDSSQLEVLNNGITIYGESRPSNGEAPSVPQRQKGDNSVHERSSSDSDRTRNYYPSIERKGPRGLRGSNPAGSASDGGQMKNRNQTLSVGGNNRGDTVIIEDDTYAIPRKRQQPPRPHSTLGLPRISPSHSRSSSMEEPTEPHGPPGGSASDWSSEMQEELSPTGDFQREGFGRQSMSEKRKGHIDPRSSEFYQRVKESRDTRGTDSLELHDESPRIRTSGSMESILSTRTNSTVHDPSLSHKRPFSQAQGQGSNLRRSSSFEELASSDTVPQMEDKDVQMWRYARIGRPRACNDSFRAAVDRSYDVAPGSEPNVMDTLEEESIDTNSLNHTQSNSARSSFSSENTNEDFHSLRRKKQKDKNRSVGILKGLIRFGKGRKSNEDPGRRSKSAERPSETDLRARQMEQERVFLAQQEQDRIREFIARRKEQEQQKQKLELQKQQQLQQQKQQQKQQSYPDHQKLMQQNRPMFYDPKNQYGQELSHPADRDGRGSRKGSQDSNLSATREPHERSRENVREGFGNREAHERSRENAREVFGNRESPRDGGFGNHENRFREGANHERSREGYGSRDASREVSQERTGVQDWKREVVGMRPGEDRRQGDDRRPGGEDHRRGGGEERRGEMGMTRADKIQYLRMQHQRQHQERHGQYPNEDLEEYYERLIQEEERKRIMDRELAERLHSRSDMERSHHRMGSLDSQTNYRQYPSESSDTSHNSNLYNYPHRERSSSRGPGQFNDPYYKERPPSRGNQQYDEFYRQADYNNVNRQTAFTRLNPQPGANYYSDPSRAYRDPKYPTVAGRRQVQTLTDPSSAKV